jgi:hypothetical protein
MSVLDSKAKDSSRTMQFAVNGAQDRVEKIESANIFAAKMGQKVVGVAFAEKTVSVTSLKSSSNDFDTSKGLPSHERDLKSATEIVDIALARHLEGVALESMTDDSMASTEVALGNQPSSDEQQKPNKPRTPTQTVDATDARLESDLAIVVCFRSTPDIGQPAFPYSGVVFPLQFGSTIIGRGKLQCLKHGSDELMEIPHNSVSKRHAKIGDFFCLTLIFTRLFLSICLQMSRRMVASALLTQTLQMVLASVPALNRSCKDQNNLSKIPQFPSALVITLHSEFAFVELFQSERERVSFKLRKGRLDNSNLHYLLWINCEF